MRVRTTRDGENAIAYDVGDHVLLIRDERGQTPTAFRGDWGKVIRVNGQVLDIMLAGHGRQRGVALERVLDFPAWNVVPCDRRGVALALERPALERPPEAKPSGPPRIAGAMPQADPASRLTWIAGAGVAVAIAMAAFALR